MTGWCRAAATSILFLALTAGTAAAGQTGVGGGTGTSTSPTSTTPTKTGTTSTKYSNAAFGKRLLSVGMSGSDVLALQHDLTALGFKTPATGIFTVQTEQRLKAFQRRYGLSVDGVAGPSSIGTLKRLLSAKLHITETALAAKELASGKATVASPPVGPLPQGDTGITGGVGLGPEASSSVELNATLVNGIAVPAPGTPLAIVTMLDAANKIAFDPYIYGGGHRSFNSRGYDCSGSVSYVLHSDGLLATPLDSSQFVKYGLAGKGNWITIYTNGPTHVYMEIAGLWFDTAAQTAANGNDRWSTTRIGEPGYGKFMARHPSGW